MLLELVAPVSQTARQDAERFPCVQRYILRSAQPLLAQLVFNC